MYERGWCSKPPLSGVPTPLEPLILLCRGAAGRCKARRAPGEIAGVLWGPPRCHFSSGPLIAGVEVLSKPPPWAFYLWYAALVSGERLAPLIKARSS